MTNMQSFILIWGKIKTELKKWKNPEVLKLGLMSLVVVGVGMMVVNPFSWGKDLLLARIYQGDLVVNLQEWGAQGEYLETEQGTPKSQFLWAFANYINLMSVRDAWDNQGLKSSWQNLSLAEQKVLFPVVQKQLKRIDCSKNSTACIILYQVFYSEVESLLLAKQEGIKMILAWMDEFVQTPEWELELKQNPILKYELSELFLPNSFHGAAPSLAWAKIQQVLK